MKSNGRIFTSFSHVVLRKPPFNLSQDHEVFFFHEYKKEIHSSYYYILNSVLLVSDTVFSLRKFKFFPFETHINGFFTPKNKIFYLKRFSFPYLKVEKAVWITQNWTSMYFHWVTDALTRYVSVIDLIEGAPILVPKEYQNFPFIEETLKFLNVPYIWYNTNKTTYVNKIYLPSHTAESGNYNVFFIKKLRELFLNKIYQKLPTKKIYISRKLAKTRRIINEDKLKDILDLSGIEIHCLENYSFVEQISLINQSSLLIGPHGAGLTNILFLQKSAKMLEIRLERDCTNNCFFSLASALDIPYYYFNGQIVNEETNDMILNLDEFNLLLNNLI